VESLTFCSLQNFYLTCCASEKLVQLISIITHELAQHQSAQFIVYFATCACVDYFYRVCISSRPRTYIIELIRFRFFRLSSRHWLLYIPFTVTSRQMHGHVLLPCFRLRCPRPRPLLFSLPLTWPHAALIFLVSTLLFNLIHRRIPGLFHIVAAELLGQEEAAEPGYY
jgi:hypothetical protein